MESKIEQHYKQLKAQAKNLMKIGDIQAYVAKLIEVENLKQQFNFQ